MHPYNTLLLARYLLRDMEHEVQFERLRSEAKGQRRTSYRRLGQTLSRLVGLFLAL